MSRRLLAIVLSLIALVSFLGCASGDVQDSLVMPDDFYFIYETGELSVDYLLVNLDTKNNIIGAMGSAPTFGSEYYYVDYYIPRDRLQELYEDIIRFDIKSYSSSEIGSVTYSV